RGVTPDDRQGADAEGADPEGADPDVDGPETQDRSADETASDRAGSRWGRRSLRRAVVLVLAAVLIATSVLGRATGPALPGLPPAPAVPVGRAAPGEVRIAGIALTDFDPSRSGDIASGAILANLYDGLTAFDPQLNVRPALARAWDADPQWRRIVFHLRDGLTFSDGSPLGPEDVVRSWRRLLDPKHPAPLAGLLSDVEGAAEYLSGASGDLSTVAITALPGAVEVRFRRSAPWFI